MLRDAQQILRDDSQLSQMVMFNVKPKGSQDKARLRKLLDFQGPELETIKLLENCGSLWLEYPRNFWRRPIPSNLTHLDPQTQVVGYFLPTIQDDA